MGVSFVENVTLESQSCWNCGGTYALNAHFVNTRREDGKSWHCPYCEKGTRFSETESEKLKKEVEYQKNRVIAEQQCHDQTKAELRETEQRRRAEKGAKTRIKNRIERGVCIHCNRSFQDLQRHMATKHKEHICEQE